MAGRDDFDFSAKMIFSGSAQGRRNWDRLTEHMIAEWSGDLEATMATMTRNNPFQIMHATGLNIVGYDNVRDFYAERFKTFQGQGFFAHRIVVADDLIVGNGSFHGVPKGVFFGVETTGKMLCLPMTVWIYFEDGLLKGEAAYLDGRELQRQIVEGTTRDKSAPVW